MATLHDPRDEPETSSLLEAALRYAAIGLRVHPLYNLRGDGSCSCPTPSTCGDRRGKHPHLTAWQRLASTDPERIRAWWKAWPMANVGVVVPPRHLVLDVDPLHGGTLAALGALPTTRVARSGSGGWHVFFRLPEDVELKKLVNLARVPGMPGVDIRTERNYLVVAPSRTPRGTYSWETSYDMPIACLPDHLLDLLLVRGQHTASTKAPRSGSQPIPEGERNTSLFRLARSLWSSGLAPTSVLAAVQSENRARCRPPLADEEVRRIVDSAHKYIDDRKIRYDAVGAIFGDLEGYAVRSQDGALVHLTTRPSEDTPQERVIALQPLRLTGRYEESTTGQQFLKIAWKEGKLWHERLIERETVMNAGKLVELAAYGAPINSVNARLVMEYLTAYEQANRQRLPLERATSHFGWRESLDQSHESGVCPLYLWGKVSLGEGTLHFLPHEGDSGSVQLAAGLTTAGTFTGWVSVIELFALYPRALLGVYAALTAPLLRELHLPSFFVNWHCRTSLGKTTLLMAAASIAGQPDGANGLIQSWNSTSVNTERLCALSTDLPVFLDDTKSADIHTMTRQLYRAASGMGKGRGTIAGRARVEHWRCVILATGEGRASDFAVEGGARARVLEIGGMPFDSVDKAALVERIRTGARQHYGHALPCFVSYLIKHQDEAFAWRRLHRMLRTKLAAGRSNIADRFAEYFAGVRVAAVLFHRACREAGRALPWPVPRFEGLWEEIAGAATEADADIRALNDVLSWARSHEEAFMGRHRVDTGSQPYPPHDGWAGRWDRTPEWPEIQFLPHKLKKTLQDLGYSDTDAIIRAWRERNWLRLDREGRHPQVRWRGGDYATERREHLAERDRLICIKRTAFEQVLGSEEDDVAADLDTASSMHGNSSA